MLDFPDFGQHENPRIMEVVEATGFVANDAVQSCQSREFRTDSKSAPFQKEAVKKPPRLFCELNGNVSLDL